MKQLRNMNFNQKIDAMKAAVERAEIELSKKNQDEKELAEIETIICSIFDNIKYEFITGDVIITPEGKRVPAWNGDEFYEALNARHPGLSFRMDSVMNAIEDMFDMENEE